MAMHFLEQNRADLIISAVHLLEGNVFDFLRWTKSDANLRGIPFVFFCAEPTELSRYVSNAVKHAAQILGASRYIAMETFDASEFHAVIADVLDSAVPRITTSWKLFGTGPLALRANRYIRRIRSRPPQCSACDYVCSSFGRSMHIA
jgi:CheY-like chemotaxis protein